MWGVSLTHPMLAFYFCGEFALHILSSVSLSPELVSILCGEFLLHIPCRLLLLLSFLIFLSRSFSYTSCTGFIFLWGVSLTHPMLASFFVVFLFFGLNLGSFSYTSRAGFIFMRGVSLTNPVLALFLSGEFLLHIPCLLFISVGSLSYTSLVGFSSSLSLLSWLHFYAGISLTHHVLAFYIYFLSIFFIWGVSLTHPALALFFCGEFLLHIPSWLYFSMGSFSYTSHDGFFLFLFSFFFNLGSFSYTSRADFIFIWGVSLTHPMLTLFLSGRFLLHVPCWHYIYVRSFSHTSHTGFFFFSFYPGSFSYTSRAGFTFLWGVSLTHPVLASFLSGEFLLHIPC